jgi:glycosyltransferase involved in cell wall biosynthesis
MNVVIINDTAHVNGGASKIALASAKGLAHRGHRVFVITAVGPVDPELLQTSGLTVLCTNQFEILDDPNRARAAIQGLWNFKARRLADELFAGLDPSDTVVHLHLWAKALSSSVPKAAIRRGYPIFCTMHDYQLACPTGTLFDHTRQEICHLKPMSLECLRTRCDSRNYGHKLWRVARQFVQQHIGALPAGIGHFVAISPLSESVLRPMLPATAKIHFISNFVDAQPCEPAAVSVNQAFVFSGRLVREKGPVMFAECARRAGVYAVFVGDGECREEVLHANPDAIITGWRPYQDGLRELRSARALVLPSRWYEAQPLVVLESAANGIPAIVPDTSAARDMVENGVTGLWFKGGSVKDLSAKITMLTDPIFASKLGTAAYRKFWSAPPTLDWHVSQLESAYRAALSSFN